jgi:hypothetical protein
MKNGSETSATCDAIRSAFGVDAPEAVRVVQGKQVLVWMNSHDLEVKGCIYIMILDEKRASQIKPHLTFDDYYGFAIPYLLRCISEGPDLEWAEPRYLAGHALVGWFVHLWNDKAIPRKRLASIKDRLARLYEQGDEGVKDAVVYSVLEHLFERRDIAKYFADWRADQVLGLAYENALMWTQERPGGG